MKHLITKVCITAGFVSLTALTSCNKQEFSPKTAPAPSKNVKLLPPATMVLIPSGIRPRIGFLPDGTTPWLFAPFDGNLIHLVQNGGTNIYQVYNPNLYAGLTANISGLKLTGLAVDRSMNPYDPNIILSYTSTSDHYLFTASRDANSNYIITASTVLTSSFAPAASGWKLHDIEYDGISGKMYGVFYHKLTNASKVAAITYGTGMCTLVKDFPGMHFTGMDFTPNSSYLPESNKMYLLQEVTLTPTTFGKLVQLDLVTLATTTTNLNLPGIPPSSGLSTTSFLARSPQTWDYLNIYGEGNGIFIFDKSSNSILSTISQKNLVQLPNTSTPDGIISSEVMTDAAN